MMHLGKTSILAICILIAGCNKSGTTDQQAKELVNNFYKTHQSAQPTAALSLKELITFRQFLSVSLFDLLKDVSVAEEAHLAQTDEDTPPLVNGDLFTTHPKGASTYRVLACEVQEEKAQCAVEVIYSDVALKTATKTTDRVILNRDARGWIIDNIEYDGNGVAGLHQGNLRKALQTILQANARPPAKS